MSRTDLTPDLLDLSRLAPPALVDTSYETILAQRLASFEARCQALGVPWDAGGTEFDPAVVLQQEDAYREILVRQAINDAARRRLVGYATGADLDWLAATFYADLGIRRMVVDPGDPTASPPVPATYESDERLTRRILLAPWAYVAAITPGGIVYRALAADVRVIDALPIKHGTADVECIVLVDDGGDADMRAEVLETVRRVLSGTGVKGMTMPVSVSHAVEVAAPVTVRLDVRTGPDKPLVESAAAVALATLAAAARRQIGRVVPTDEIIATARTAAGAVLKLHLDAPIADVDPGADGVAVLGPITVTAEVPS